jgi:hypothetical protein
MKWMVAEEGFEGGDRGVFEDTMPVFAWIAHKPVKIKAWYFLSRWLPITNLLMAYPDISLSECI